MLQQFVNITNIVSLRAMSFLLFQFLLPFFVAACKTYTHQHTQANSFICDADETVQYPKERTHGRRIKNDEMKEKHTQLSDYNLSFFSENVTHCSTTFCNVIIMPTILQTSPFFLLFLSLHFFSL